MAFRLPNGTPRILNHEVKVRNEQDDPRRMSGNAHRLCVDLRLVDGVGPGRRCKATLERPRSNSDRACGRRRWSCRRNPSGHCGCAGSNRRQSGRKPNTLDPSRHMDQSGDAPEGQIECFRYIPHSEERGYSSRCTRRSREDWQRVSPRSRYADQGNRLERRRRRKDSKRGRSLLAGLPGGWTAGHQQCSGVHRA